MKTLILTIILLSASLLIADDHASKKAVLVTGASSGIGKSIAMDLAKRGYYVFAGARKDKDLKALDAIDNMEGIAVHKDERGTVVTIISDDNFNRSIQDTVMFQFRLDEKAE